MLVGLDCAEPMMFLLLHVTCSCIFHAYIPFFSFFMVLLFISAFLPLSLSLSLSPFLSDSLRVAPKHKSTPSRNPFRSETSSSSNSTPLHVRFYDEKAREDFSENFSRCGIHSKRQVVLSDFSNTDLPTVINSRGWESLYEILVSCPTVIIHEFYSNMHSFDYSIPCFLTSIRGIRIVVTLKLISDVLHVPKVSHPYYPSDLRLKTSSCLSFVRHLHLGVNVKTPIARVLQKV